MSADNKSGAGPSSALETGARVATESSSSAGDDDEAGLEPSADGHAAPGTIVDGRYRVTGTIADGSWSVVYDAEHVRTGQRVALKMLLSNLPCGDEHAERRFFREAQITAQLEHPNTVRVFDVGRTDGDVLYIACERLSGRTLEDELEQMRTAGEMISEHEALDIAEQVLRSLREAHGKDLVHRDLKPANLFVAEVGGDRIIKVLDFGIARLLGQRITQRGIALGSPDYMSSEQCACQDVDGRSDLYAVAAILFQLVTGRPPYMADDAWDVIDLHRSGDVPDPRLHTKQALSEAFARFVMRGLSKHPDARWPDAATALIALADVRARSRDQTESTRRRVSSTHLPVKHRRKRVATGRWSSSSDMPAADLQVFSQEDTEQLKRGDSDLVTSSAAMRSTAKYGVVTEADLRAHTEGKPALEQPPEQRSVKHPTAIRALAITLLLIALGLAGLLAVVQHG